MSTWELKTHSIGVSFGTTPIVHEADLELRRGEVTVIVGPNGSGKSTLLRAMSRLLRPTSGTISLPDADDAGSLSSRAFARRVAILTQQRPTPSGITVRDIVEFGRHPHRAGWRRQDEHGAQAVDGALRLTGLDSLADHELDTLSGGQLQRAWFASALAQDTSTLLLDEPTNHLDLRYQVEVLELIRSLADDHGIAIGVVLHDLNHAAEVADRVVVIHEGRIVADDTAAEALTPELLSRVYEIPVTVRHDELSGGLVVRARSLRAALV